MKTNYIYAVLLSLLLVHSGDAVTGQKRKVRII